MERPAGPATRVAAASATTSTPPATTARWRRARAGGARAGRPWWAPAPSASPPRAARASGPRNTPTRSGSTAPRACWASSTGSSIPFNEWINRHEGDWEHVNVVLKGDGEPWATARASARPATSSPFTAGGSRPGTSRASAAPSPAEDHVVVFVGGRSRLLWWTRQDQRRQLSAARGLRGRGLGPAVPQRGHARARALHRRGRLRRDPVARTGAPGCPRPPELSWLTLDFYAGQQRVFTNPPLVDWLGYGGPVLQPGRRPAWNARKGKRRFPHAGRAIAARLSLPVEWPLIAVPWPGRPSARPSAGRERQCTFRPEAAAGRLEPERQQRRERRRAQGVGIAPARRRAAGAA